MKPMYHFAMTNNSDSMQRWLGMFFLAVSFAMMMWGQIVLQAELSGVAFVLYWGACFLVSMTAVVMAVLDVRRVLREIRAERMVALRRAVRGIKRPEQCADGSLAEK